MTEDIFLEPGRSNPKSLTEGRARERAKKERRAKSWERYWASVKEREEEEAKKPKVEEKAPRIKRVEMPVYNPSDNPVIQSRD